MNLGPNLLATEIGVHETDVVPRAEKESGAAILDKVSYFGNYKLDRVLTVIVFLQAAFAGPSNVAQVDDTVLRFGYQTSLNQGINEIMHDHFRSIRLLTWRQTVFVVVGHDVTDVKAFESV